MLPGLPVRLRVASRMFSSIQKGNISKFSSFASTESMISGFFFRVLMVSSSG